MKCYKCGNKIKVSNPICPYCGTNVSFTTKSMTVTPRESSINLGGIFFLIMFLPFISTAGIFVLGVLNVLGKSNLVNTILNVIFYAGIILLALNILLLIKHKGDKLNRAHMHGVPMTPKSKFKFSITWTIFAIYLIVIPYIARGTIKNTANLAETDYATVEYIEISNVKVPSLYSVVGERKIIFNLGLEDEYDEELEITFDSITITYENLTEEDINLYKAELLEQGYILLSMIDEESIEHLFYVKNDLDADEYMIISIDKMQFTYSVSQGRYENRLKGYTVVNNA